MPHSTRRTWSLSCSSVAIAMTFNFNHFLKNIHIVRSRGEDQRTGTSSLTNGHPERKNIYIKGVKKLTVYCKKTLLDLYRNNLLFYF